MSMQVPCRLRVEQVSVVRNGTYWLNDISFSLGQGEHLAITGASGSGKTLLGHCLSGQIPYTGEIRYTGAGERIVWVPQQHNFRARNNTADLYYQQRFNAQDADNTLTVSELLNLPEPEARHALERLQIGYLYAKPIIQLSNGEHKRLQLTRALLQDPTVLILDQPFIGLDVATRRALHDLLNTLADRGILIILISSPGEIPACITRVLTLSAGRLDALETAVAFIRRRDQAADVPKSGTRVSASRLTEPGSPLLADQDTPEFRDAIRMEEVTVRYGGIAVLDKVSWRVQRGERWLLAGPNGAGKSTLLSLVTGDNPQAYANKVFVFDRRRGTGETIWDIKRRIGYLSPELHLFFDRNCSVFDAVASGLFDTIGLFRQVDTAGRKKVNSWMGLTGIAPWKDRALGALSLGDQRLVLLTRALVKHPPVLILDEPCQGLDEEREAEMLALIDAICLAGDKTLVYVSHYAHARPSCIGNLIELGRGRVVKAGALTN